MILGGTLLILFGITLILSDRPISKAETNFDSGNQRGRVD